ncbi:MAG: sugar phosphate isomerase/epimerase [Clostridia bacterium]|nr:sugar phosphate isomerase/epimerase [Clostridia bacterium]
MKLGFLANGEMLGWDYEKLCAFIRESGYDCVELIDDIIFAPGKTAQDNAALLKAVEKNGLEISEVLLQHDFVIPDANARRASIDTVKANIAKISDLGVKTANLFTGPVPWMPDSIIINRQVSAQQAWQWVFEAFDEIIPVAEKYGVKLAVENVWGMLVHDFYTNKYLQSRYTSKNLGVNLDPSHDALYGNTDMELLIKGWGKEKIFHVHVKDAVGIPSPGKFTFPVIGEGIVNFKVFFNALKEIGYDGCASVEFESWTYRNVMWEGQHAPAAPAMRKILETLI